MRIILYDESGALKVGIRSVYQVREPASSSESLVTSYLWVCFATTFSASLLKLSAREIVNIEAIQSGRYVDPRCLHFTRSDNVVVSMVSLARSRIACLTTALGHAYRILIERGFP